MSFDSSFFPFLFVLSMAAVGTGAHLIGNLVGSRMSRKKLGSQTPVADTVKRAVDIVPQDPFRRPTRPISEVSPLDTLSATIAPSIEARVLTNEARFAAAQALAAALQSGLIAGNVETAFTSLNSPIESVRAIQYKVLANDQSNIVHNVRIPPGDALDDEFARLIEDMGRAT